MTDRIDRKPALSVAGQGEKEQQRQRLAAALRDNLRKRKAQKRARSGTLAVPAEDGPADGDAD